MVNGSRATSVITPNAGKAAFKARTARCAKPSGFHASSALADLADCGVTGNSANAGIPNATACAASCNNRSMLKRSTPGMEEMASRWFSPSSTKTGQIKSFTVNTFSRIKRRENSSRRIRRIREWGNWPGKLAILKLAIASCGKPPIVRELFPESQLFKSYT